MYPVLAFALDRQQMEDVKRDLEASLERGAESSLLICDPNPPLFPSDEDRRVWDAATDQPDSIPPMRKPTDVVHGTTILMAYSSDVQEMLTDNGFKSIGDPDQN